MKTLTFLFWLLLPFAAKSQSLFNYTPTEIKAKWSGVEMKYDTWGDNNALLMMSFQKDNLEISYFFNKDNRSVCTIIHPLAQGQLQFLIEHYNKRYVIINNTKWKFYDDGSIYLCELLEKEGKYFFMWTVEE